MGASVEIVLLTTVAALAVLYAFYVRVRRDRAFRRLLRWLRASRPDEWEAVQRPNRWLNPVGAVQRLRSGALSDDAEFETRYQEMKSRDPHFIVAMAIGALATALVVVGTRTLGWAY